MAIPPWAVEALRRGVGGVLDKVPPEKIEQLKKRAGDLLADLPQTAARGVDSMMRGAKAGKDSIQRWTRRHVALVTPVVNASGCLCHPSVAGVPLCNDAIDVAAEAFQSGSLNTAGSHDRLARRLTSCLSSSDLGILVAATVDGACTAVAGNSLGGNMYFHRSQSQRLPNGTPIPDAFAVGVAQQTKPQGKIVEVGSIDRVDPMDSRQVMAPATLIAVESGAANCDWYRCESEKADSDFLKVVYLPAAAWNVPAGSEGAVANLPAILQRLASSADLVIAPGDGSMGGPRCGLIVGNQTRLEMISKSAIWASLAADVSVQAAMAVTLELLVSAQIEDVPVQAMMHTSAENLRSRAERLATRLAAEPVVRTCQITDRVATICSTGSWSLPSRQLKLAHRDLSASDWAARLIGEVPAVIVGIDEESIVVDLRWIQPSDDAALVATLVGSPLGI